MSMSLSLVLLGTLSNSLVSACSSFAEKIPIAGVLGDNLDILGAILDICVVYGGRGIIEDIESKVNIIISYSLKCQYPIHEMIPFLFII